MSSGSHYESYFSRHLYASGDLNFSDSAESPPKTLHNLQTERAFRKYFGKKLRSLASNSFKRRTIPISTYRCKALKTLTLLSYASPKSPIISLKKMDIWSHKSSLNKISGYKNLISLKIDVLPFDLNLTLVSQLRQLVHLKYLSLKIGHNLLAQGSRYILGLKALTHLNIEIQEKRDANSAKDKVIVRDLYLTLMKSKTLSFLILNIRHMTHDSNSLALLFETLSQVTIPHVQIDITYRQEYNIDTKCLEQALSNIDLFNFDGFPFFVSLSTNQENPHQSVAQARRKLNLYKPANFFHRPRYVPRAQLGNFGIAKNDFNLAESLKLIFCDTLDPSFSLFKASNIKCIKAIRVNCQPLQIDKTLEGLKILQTIIQNSPSLEQVTLSQANFHQQEVAVILGELANLKQLETLKIMDSVFPGTEYQKRKISISSFSSLKKLILWTLILNNQKIFELPFELTLSKSLTDIVINYSYRNPEDMLETIQKLSSLEKITIINMPILTDERCVLRFIDKISRLTKLKEVYIFSEKISLSKTGVIPISKDLHDKVMNLLNKNKSIEKFIIKEEINRFGIKCIRY